MIQRTLNAATAPDPVGAYAQAVEIAGAQRLLFISGQIPVARDGTVPSGWRRSAARPGRTSRRSFRPPA